VDTIVNLDRIWPERAPGYPNCYMGQGFVERSKGAVIQEKTLRATVVLNDHEARKALDWFIENPTYTFGYPFTFPETNRIVGVEIVRQGVPV
jgi:hypothetical protein